MLNQNSSKLAIFLVSLFLYLGASVSQDEKYFYPSWAHTHQVWLHAGDDSTQENVLQLVEDYLAHNISVGAVNIDSGWSTGFNNYVVDKTHFPDLSNLIHTLHSKNIRVLLWTTSMIDTDIPDGMFEEANQKGYMIKDRFGKSRPIKWWHGSGGLIDYTNPEALDWWHEKLDQVLDLGIDGWKCDGTDPYILEYILAGGARGYNDKSITREEYSKQYYEDFLNYCNSKRSNQCLIWSRPTDCLMGSGKVETVCMDYSPKDVMFSGWVGDEDGTWQGLQACASKALISANKGYLNFGCDIGGYRSTGGERDIDLYLRWVQLGSLLPHMENGGATEHRPWKFDDKTINVLEIYQKFHHLHMALQPYFYTVGILRYPEGKSAMTPSVEKTTVYDKLKKVEHFGYTLGDELYVQPILTNTTSTTKISFPEIESSASSSSLWINYWKNDLVYSPKSTLDEKFALDDYPLYVKSGTIIPTFIYATDIESAVLNDKNNNIPHGMVLTIRRPVNDQKIEKEIYFGDNHIVDISNKGCKAYYKKDSTAENLEIAVTAYDALTDGNKNGKVWIDIMNIELDSSETIDEMKITVEKYQDNNSQSTFTKCQENKNVKFDSYFDEKDSLSACYVLQPSEFTREQGKTEYDMRIYLQNNDYGSIITIPFTKNQTN